MNEPWTQEPLYRYAAEHPTGRPSYRDIVAIHDGWGVDFDELDAETIANIIRDCLEGIELRRAAIASGYYNDPEVQERERERWAQIQAIREKSGMGR